MILLDGKSERKVTKHCLNRTFVLLFREVKLFHVRFVTNNISLHQPVNYMPTTRQWEIHNSMFRRPVEGKITVNVNDGNPGEIGSS